MKLRNKKTGEIGKILKQLSEDNQIEVITDDKLYVVKSLADLNEEWEDYEDPKGYWYMSNRGDIRFIDDEGTDWDNERKQIGNYFETKEEAEKAVEKLKAWKRLKDKGFELSGCFNTDDVEDDEVLVMTNGYIPHIDDDILADLEIVFGGEE